MWTLRLLNEGGLVDEGGRRIVLERKAAGLLAFLCVQGASARSRLAGLLWPDSGEERARANLRKTLSRLRQATGAELVIGGDPLSLGGDVHSDLEAALSPHLRSPFPSVLLSWFDYSDCPEFAEWLSRISDDLRVRRVAALEKHADAQEAAGEIRQAIATARRILDDEPYSERAFRRLIRLHYLLGDRAAALRAYEICERVLRDELGTEPSPKTREYARIVQLGKLPPTRKARRRSELPLSLLRPPRLVGREAQWEEMEAAWQAKKFVFVSGPAGSGKSRLAHDFVSSRKSATLVLESRPGDALVPLASHARSTRKLLAAWPSLRLAPWVRRELARMVPELRHAGDPPLPPLEEESARLRFCQAQVEMLRSLDREVTILADDLQFCDAESAQVGHYMFASVAGPDSPVRMVMTYRPQDLPPRLAEFTAAFVREGIGVQVPLPPLDTRETRLLLRELRLPQLREVEEELVHASGGIPAILLEMVQGLLHEAPDRPLLVLSRKMQEVLRRRIARLPEPSQRIAKVAAVAGDRFSLELAAAVLGAHPLDLSDAWRELEAAQILRGGRLAHGLLQEAILAEISPEVRAHLEARVAQFLDERQPAPSRIALHGEPAGQGERAASLLLLGRNPQG